MVFLSFSGQEKKKVKPIGWIYPSEREKIESLPSARADARRTEILSNASTFHRNRIECIQIRRKNIPFAFFLALRPKITATKLSGQMRLLCAHKKRRDAPQFEHYRRTGRRGDDVGSLATAAGDDNLRLTTWIG